MKRLCEILDRLMFERDTYTAGVNQWHVQCPDDSALLADLTTAVEAGELLRQAACFLEDMNDDPAYKRGVVKSLLSEIKDILTKMEA